jgi:hypothetical protein
MQKRRRIQVSASTSWLNKEGHVIIHSRAAANLYINLLVAYHVLLSNRQPDDTVSRNAIIRLFDQQLSKKLIRDLNQIRNSCHVNGGFCR